MENKNKTIMDYCEADVRIVTNNKRITTGVVMLIIGIIMLVSGFVFLKGSQAVEMLLLVTGAVLAVVGLVFMFTSKTMFISAQTQSRMTKSEYFFNGADLIKLTEMFTSRNMEALRDMKVVPDSGLKMECLMSEDKEFVALLLEKYEPFSFFPVSGVQKFTNDEARKVYDVVMSLKQQ